MAPTVQLCTTFLARDTPPPHFTGGMVRSPWRSPVAVAVAVAPARSVFTEQSGPVCGDAYRLPSQWPRQGHRPSDLTGHIHTHTPLCVRAVHATDWCAYRQNKGGDRRHPGTDGHKDGTPHVAVFREALKFRFEGTYV